MQPTKVNSPLSQSMPTRPDLLYRLKRAEQILFLPQPLGTGKGAFDSKILSIGDRQGGMSDSNSSDFLEITVLSHWMRLPST